MLITLVLLQLGAANIARDRIDRLKNKANLLRRVYSDSYGSVCRPDAEYCIMPLCDGRMHVQWLR